MPCATNIHGPRASSGRKDLRHDQIRKQEMPDVVRSKLGLESVFRGGVGCRHDGGVVDEPVNRLYVSVDLLRRCADLSLRAEVEFEKAVSGRQAR